MKLSVAIITYNQEGFVQQAIDSVLSQQVCFDYEVVIGDDGSSDATPEILIELQKRWPDRIRLLLAPENAGDYGLSNLIRTLKVCTGQYVARLDGDDYWSSTHKLQRQVEFLDTHPSCTICCHAVHHVHDGGRYSVSRGPRDGPGVYAVSDLLLRNFVPTVSTVYRHPFMDDLPAWFAEGPLGSMDWILHVLAARHGDIGYLNDVMAVHRIRDGTVSSQFGVRGLLEDRLRAYELLRPCLPGYGAVLDRAAKRTRIQLAIARLGTLPFRIRRALLVRASPARQWWRRVAGNSSRDCPSDPSRQSRNEQGAAPKRAVNKWTAGTGP